MDNLNMYAVLFSKIANTDDTNLLMPIKIIKGEISNGIFIEKKEEIQNKYFNVETENSNNFYAFPISKETLNDKYSKYIDVFTFDYFLNQYFEDVKKQIFFQKIDKDEKEYKTYMLDKKSSIVAEIDINDNFIDVRDNFDAENIKKNPDFLEKIVPGYIKNKQLTESEILYQKPQIQNKIVNKKSIDTEVELDIGHIYDEVTKRVLFQDQQVKQILTSILKNYISNDKRIKSNILIAGPTGVGKTEILRNIAQLIKIPMIEVDATEYTIEGYIGKSVSDILERLYRQAEKNISIAQRGIIVVDEIDKKSDNSQDKVATRGVLETLLKLMEGKTTTFEFENKTIQFDTSKITFISAGAFSDLYKKIEKRPIGFNNNTIIETKKTIITPNDLINYGLIPEFVGRNNTIVSMNLLGYEEYKEILRESDISKLKTNMEFLKKINISLKYNDDVIDQIAKKALETNTGARMLDNIIEYALQEATFEILKNPNKYKELVLTEETVRDNKRYILK